MSNTKKTAVPEQKYPPEFKLRIVLEYMHSPKRLKQNCKANQISEDLVQQWHQEFVERAGQIFAEPPEPHSRPSDNEIDGMSVRQPSTADVSIQSPWGIRISNGLREIFSSPSSPSQRPAWLKGWDADNWERHPGVAFWDEQKQVIEFFYARPSIQLLEKLRTHQEWKTEGFPIIRHISRRVYPAAPVPEHSTRKKKSVQTPSTTDKPQYEEIDEELFRLSPIASAEALSFLTLHEPLLKELAADEQARIDEASKIYWDMVFRGAREQEVIDHQQSWWLEICEPLKAVSVSRLRRHC